jgi:transcriptional regulator with XRE-family HTH domain
MSDSQTLLDKDKLRGKRIRAGYTRTQLAGKVGVHVSHIGLLERGERGTTPKTLGVLAEVLGCDIADLMPDEKSVAA